MPDSPEFKQINLSPEMSSNKKKTARKRRPKADRKKPVAADRPEEKKIKQELKEIYQNDDGTMPNMSDFQKKGARGARRAFIALLFACVFLGAVAWAGFFVFQPASRFAEEDMLLSISGDEQVTAGQAVYYRIRYRNAQNVPLGGANLQLKYPEGFVFTGSSQEPSNDKKDEWRLGTIGSHGSGYVDIQGRLFGDLNKKQSFRAFLNYTPVNFNSEFQKVASLNTEIVSAPAVLSITAPSEAVPGAGVEFLIDISKISDKTAQNLALVFEPTGDFKKMSAEPASDKDNQYQWTFSELPEKLRIKLNGVFGSATGEGADLKFKLVGWKDENRQVDPYVFGIESKSIRLLKADLSVGLAINGSMDELAVQPGEALNSSIVLKNSGQSPLKNLNVRLVFDTPSFDKKSLLDWSKLDDKLNGQINGEQMNETMRRGQIVWDRRQLKGLSQLSPGQEVSIDVSLPIKSGQIVDLTKFTTHFIDANVEVKYENGNGQKLLSSNPVRMVVNSDLSVDVRDRISGDNQDREVHDIEWVLSNNFHELKDIELSADVYGDVIWDEEALAVPAGEAKFDAEQKQLVWKVSAMPVSVDVLALRFAITVNKKNPSQTNLTSKVKVKAKDAVTNQDIILVGDEILFGGN